MKYYLFFSKKQQNYKMKKTLILSTLTLGTGAANAAIAAWDGGAGNFYGNANWTIAGTPAQTLANQNGSNDDITIGSGDVTYNPGGDLGQGWDTSNLTISGGSLTQTVGNWTQINGSTILTVSGGTFSSAANNFNLSSSAQVNLSSGTFTNSGGTNFNVGTSGADTAAFNMTGGTFNKIVAGEFKLRGGSTGSITGGTANIRFLGLGDFGQSNLNLGGTGTLNLTDGNGGAGNAGFYRANSSYVDLTSTGATFHIDNIDVAQATAAYLTSDKVRANGDANDALLQVLSDGGSGVNITLIPEPSSTALLGLGGIAFILRRRK